jgi:hypothetical protein
MAWSNTIDLSTVSRALAADTVMRRPWQYRRDLDLRWSAAPTRTVCAWDELISQESIDLGIKMHRR